jgi:hypothetical protein
MESEQKAAGAVAAAASVQAVPVAAGVPAVAAVMVVQAVAVAELRRDTGQCGRSRHTQAVMRLVYGPVGTRYDTRCGAGVAAVPK